MFSDHALAASFLSPLVLQSPRYLSDVDPWHGHIPFAFWATLQLRPSTFVELGTHKGDSYLAFCQAVKHLGLSTACFAIDTWAGDEHSGLYDASVLKSLRLVHDQEYSKFSQLIQAKFDEAVNQFEAETVDLLHIDGLHTYDAVKHDFETWSPKISPQGVVLFHDTNVRDRNFGVWRFWSEISKKYPNFEFKHSHGLGVLGVGKNLPEPFLNFLNLGAFERQTTMDYFAILGHRSYLLRRVDDLTGQQRNLERELSQIYGSRCWRFTAPLRKSVTAFRSIFSASGGNAMPRPGR